MDDKPTPGTRCNADADIVQYVPKTSCERKVLAETTICFLMLQKNFEQWSFYQFVAVRRYMPPVDNYAYAHAEC